MKDEFRRNWFKVMGWMARPKCDCCNWTMGKHRKTYKRIANKQVRARLKEDLRRENDKSIID
ncbi:MAG: hypothetical protein PF569_02360 [Candidatus Woesearchaeota archaeon]|jgi:hypothetical protein|nr:hypothetical protein [Candidatus Woesearchaeota archaeon]